MAIYELLAEAGADVPQYLDQYAGAFNLYQQRQFQEALGVLEAIDHAGQADAACRLLADRCRAYSQAPPPEGLGRGGDQDDQIEALRQNNRGRAFRPQPLFSFTAAGDYWRRVIYSSLNAPL